MFYKLNDDKSVCPCSRDEWSTQLYELAVKNTKHVAETIINGFRISTVFLGLDHAYGLSSLPKLFETMIFEVDSLSDIYMKRYSTWEEAEKGHQEAIKWLAMIGIELPIE